ncbi:MAG: transposase [Bacteroidota bacterium]
MSTFRQIYYQIVFGTKYREETITPDHENELYKYIWGIINKNKCKLYRINGMLIISIYFRIYILQSVSPIS